MTTSRPAPRRPPVGATGTGPTVRPSVCESVARCSVATFRRVRVPMDSVAPSSGGVRGSLASGDYSPRAVFGVRWGAGAHTPTHCSPVARFLWSPGAPPRGACLSAHSPGSLASGTSARAPVLPRPGPLGRFPRGWCVVPYVKRAPGIVLPSDVQCKPHPRQCDVGHNCQ